MALWRRGQVQNIIVHSDQGSTYVSGYYQQQLRDNGLRCSMSRKGECLDNAVAESFFGTLKNELVYHCNDTLEGLKGNDVLLGGDGDDEYLIKQNHGDNTIVDAQGNDEITFGSNISHDQLWFQREGDSLKVSVVGGNSSATISDWYADSTKVIETINVSDAQIQAGNQLEQLVTAMAAFNPPASGAMQISDEARDSLAPVLAASWSVS